MLPFSVEQQFSTASEEIFVEIQLPRFTNLLQVET
jgi:hypothetical protein